MSTRPASVRIVLVIASLALATATVVLWPAAASRAAPPSNTRGSNGANAVPLTLGVR